MKNDPFIEQAVNAYAPVVLDKNFSDLEKRDFLRKMLEEVVTAKMEKQYPQEFVEWLGLNYIRLHGCWVHRYASQTDKSNRQHTEDLYEFWKNNKFVNF